MVTKDYVLAVLSADLAGRVQLRNLPFSFSVVRAILRVRSEWQHRQLHLSQFR